MPEQTVPSLRPNASTAADRCEGQVAQESASNAHARAAQLSSGPSAGGWAAVLLVIGLFAFNLVTASRERPWSDATPVWEVAESLVERHTVAIRTRWPSQLPRGADGRIYAAAPLFQSLVHIPGAALRSALIDAWPSTQMRRLSWPWAAHLAPALAGALTALVFFLACRQQGVGAAASLVATGFLAFATTIWVYARSPYSEILQALCFTFFFVRVVQMGRAATAGNALWVGFAAGLLVSTKLLFVLALPGAALYVVACLKANCPSGLDKPGAKALLLRILRLAGCALAAFAPFLLITLLYNRVRWGGFFASAYDLSASPFSELPLVGLWGLFLSPGKSLFLYSPPLVLAFVGLPRLWRAHRQLLLLLVLTVAPVVLLYARFLYWGGDYAWGPRYLVFAIPALMIPVATLVQVGLVWASTRVRRRLLIAALSGVFALGLFVQLLGNAFHWDHFIRIAIEARHRWLGAADKSGSVLPTEDGLCGACFEDVHAATWLPPFNPVEGHLWLWRHVRAGDDFQAAQLDAPWRRYTSLTLDIEQTYSRARVDWWYLDFLKSGPRSAGIALLIAFSAVSVAGIGGFCFRLAPSLGRGLRRGTSRKPSVHPEI